MENGIETSLLVPLDEAGRILHTTGLRVLMLIKRNTLEGRLHHGTWYVTRKSLAEMPSPGSDEALPLTCHALCARSHCSCT